MNKEFVTTFIFSAHDNMIVNIADHVIRLKDGLVSENSGKEKAIFLCFE